MKIEVDYLLIEGETAEGNNKEAGDCCCLTKVLTEEEIAETVEC